MDKPCLYIVPTPVGNMEDITLRALRVLREADLIAAEDTRVTGKLLKAHDIANPLVALHQHNEHRKAGDLVQKCLNEGLALAVVSDAGTPGLSDPGFLIVREAVKADLRVEVLPGATAMVPALVGSGLPCDRFVFEGFLPHKKGRQTRLKALQEETRTMVFYESTHRLHKCLGEFVTWFGESRQACVARELSKIHEEYVRGTLAELVAHFEHGISKGEIVIILAGKE